MNNVVGIVLSFVFILAIIGIAQLLLNFAGLSASLTRKVVHIGVAHWWFLAMYFFDSLAAALVGPVSFTIINYASYRLRIFKAMEHEGRRKNLGTVYFPISLIILVIMSFSGWMPTYVAGIGVLIMGYGDGLASIVGERYGRTTQWVHAAGKSVAGIVTMFAASCIVVVLFLLVLQPEAGFMFVVIAAVSTGALAAAVEFVTPYGLDNITVPVTTALFFFALFA